MVKGVGIRFEGNAVVVLARQKSPDVEFSKPLNPKLPILLDVDEFVEQGDVPERPVGYDDIGEGDGGHQTEVRQVREPHAREHRVERRVLDPEPIERGDADRVEHLGLEEARDCRLLSCRERYRLAIESLTLGGDVFRDKDGDPLDLLGRSKKANKDPEHRIIFNAGLQAEQARFVEAIRKLYWAAPWGQKGYIGLKHIVENI